MILSCPYFSITGLRKQLGGGLVDLSSDMSHCKFEDSEESVNSEVVQWLAS